MHFIKLLKKECAAMSELNKKPEQTNPDSYSPKTPKLAGLMMDSPVDNIVNGEEIPFLFKKQIIHLSKSVLVGKKVTYPTAKQGVPEEEGGNPHLSLLWDACGRDGTFDWLESQNDSVLMEAYLGLYYNINIDNDGMFSYLVGSLMAEGAAVPAGFACHAIPETDAAICWFKYEKGEDIWAINPHGVVDRYMAEQGYAGLFSGASGWCSELYPFGEQPDEILGYLIACREKVNEV